MEQKDLPIPAHPQQYPPLDPLPPEETDVQATSFVVRIWRQTGAVDSQCRGWIEHVQSGKRTFFLGLDRLPVLIATHIGIPIRRGRGWWNRLRRWRTRIVDHLAQTGKGRS